MLSVKLFLWLLFCLSPSQKPVFTNQGKFYIEKIVPLIYILVPNDYFCTFVGNKTAIQRGYFQND